MAIIALLDVALVVTKGKMNGQACWNTFHYRLDTLTAPITVNTALSNLHAALDGDNQLFDRLCAASPDNFVIEEVDYQVISPARYMKQTLVATHAVGEVGSDAITSNLMASITRRGEEATRNNVGGIRVAAPTTALEAASGEWAVGYKALLSNLADELLQAAVAAGGAQIWGPGLFGPWQNPVFRPIVATAVSEEVRVMRRRTVGRGI